VKTEPWQRENVLKSQKEDAKKKGQRSLAFLRGKSPAPYEKKKSHPPTKAIKSDKRERHRIRQIIPPSVGDARASYEKKQDLDIKRRVHIVGLIIKREPQTSSVAPIPNTPKRRTDTGLIGAFPRKPSRKKYREEEYPRTPSPKS